MTPDECGDGGGGADDHDVVGCHGTIARQEDEAHYDDRVDADDDEEKGRIKFPMGTLYGRERELGILRGVYDACSADRRRSAEDEDAGEDDDGSGGEGGGGGSPAPTEPRGGSSVVFLSGYSGIGKSALVNEFARQVKDKYQRPGSSPIMYAHGKYTEQSAASAPFSALADVLERLASDLSRVNGETEEGEKTPGHDLRLRVWDKIKESDIIGEGTEGNRVLRGTFPAVAPLLDNCKSAADSEGVSSAHPSMNAIKESTRAFLSAVCETLDQPLILFLDDLQWADEPSFEMLSFLMSGAGPSGAMFICAYRSNEVDDGHSFSRLMETVTKSRKGSVEKMDLFSLSPQAVTQFIADSVKKEADDGVAELAEAVYQKTMGNIFFVMQALEELVRKNTLFYDVMCFEWRWVVSKMELANFISDDVVETVKGKINELSTDIRYLLAVMAYIPNNSLDTPMLRVLMNCGELKYENDTVGALLERASDEGMLLFSSDSQRYIFAHDRIRQASLELAKEEDQEHLLLLHISEVMMDFSQGTKMEWTMYVAVDLLNSLPPHKTNRVHLIKLNLRVSKIARSRGSIDKESDLLDKAIKCLRSSGIDWKGEYYGLTVELYNAAIVSQYKLGVHDKCEQLLKVVLNNATKDDKLEAYIHQLQCRRVKTSDYSQAALDGCEILNLYGFDIPKSVTKVCMMKEEAKVRMTLRNRSYASLADLPFTDGKMFDLVSQVQTFCLFSSNDELVKLLSWRAIQYAVKHGVDRKFPPIVGLLAMVCAKQGKVDVAQELGNATLVLTEKMRGDAEIFAMTQVITHGHVLGLLRPFRYSADPLLQSYNTLRLTGGGIDLILGSILAYFEAYFAAGLELGPLLESKLLAAEQHCRDVDQHGFLSSFQIYRQFVLNLRKRTPNPSVLVGEAFKGREVLDQMNSYACKMALRDSSSMCLQLAFVFWDRDAMSETLKILCDYPLQDICLPRTHNRLCFIGLAAFALHRSQGIDDFLKLGKNCLAYFANLNKHGSVNAKPVYLFMLAMKGPSRDTFKRAIDACSDASLIHLEAMAKERYAAFLIEQNEVKRAKDYISSSYWKYKDWGANAKAVLLLKQHDFLKDCSRETSVSVTLSTSKSTTTNEDQTSFYHQETGLSLSSIYR